MILSHCRITVKRQKNGWKYEEVPVPFIWKGNCGMKHSRHLLYIVVGKETKKNCTGFLSQLYFFSRISLTWSCGCQLGFYTSAARLLKLLRCNLYQTVIYHMREPVHSPWGHQAEFDHLILYLILISDSKSSRVQSAVWEWCLVWSSSQITTRNFSREYQFTWTKIVPGPRYIVIANLLL